MEVLNEIKISPFAAEWWDSFMETTGNLSKTSVFKDCLNKAETALFRGYVLQIIRELNTLRTSKYGYRVFIDGKLLDNSQMQHIYDQPPLAHESIDDWTQRVFGDQKFGIIINKGEKFNLELSQNIALKTADLFERVGFPREGINFTLFIGNYDKTPLGIHQDKKGENVMHFHLGPGGKTMYTWDKDEYAQLAGEKKQNNMDIDRLLPYATQFSFEEGDLYFMPQGEYHVGAQEGLSVAITLWQYNHTTQKLITKLHATLLEEFMRANDGLLFPDKSRLDDVSGFDESLLSIQMPAEVENLGYRDLMRETYKDLRYSIHSNAGYRTSPIPRKDFSLEPNAIVQSQKPFQILYRTTRDAAKLHVFIRGIKIELNKFDCIINLIDAINTWQPFEVSSLFEMLDSEWPVHIKKYLINLFYANHGILKIN